MPTVTIDGAEVANSWAFGVPRVALAGLSIEWGRDSLVDQPGPRASTVELLEFDLLGVAWRAESWIGSSLKIAAGSRVLLNGVVTAQDATEVRVHAGGRARDAIRYTLTATDMWGIWENVKPSGPWNGAPLRATGGVVYGTTPAPWGIGGWGTAFTSTRLDQLAPHLAPWVTVEKPAEKWSPPAHDAKSTESSPQSIQVGVKSGELITLADHVRRCMSAVGPLAVAEADPAGTVRSIAPAEARTVRLGAAGSSVNMLITGGPITQIAPATVSVDDPRELPRALADQRVHALTTVVDGVRYTFLPKLTQGSMVVREEQVKEEDESTTLRERVPAGKASTAEVELDLGATMGSATPRPDGDPITSVVALQGHDAALANVQQSAALAAVVNDHLMPPQLTAHGFGPLVRTTALGPILFRSNRFAVWDRVPAQYQLIGGVLRWDGDEWTHDLTLAPAIDHARRVLTTAEAFGPIKRRTIRQLSSTLTILDLALLTTESDPL